MSKKETTKNKTFKSVKDKLEFIQKSCYETELFEDLAVLFKKKKFNNVRITHGPNEFGKDLVFSRYDEDFEEDKWYAVIVKNKPATQNDFVKGNEIANQINVALSEPYTNPKGEEKIVSKLFIVINGTVTPNATKLISKFIEPSILPNIKIWDYQGLKEQIERHTKESFLDNNEPFLNLYTTEQQKKLSDISISNNVFDMKFDDIDQIFVNVQTTYSRELKKINNYITYDKSDSKYKEEDIEGSNEILNSNKNFIIHGIPTSGKTLFLKRIGLKALNSDKPKPNAVFYFDLQNHTTKDIDINDLVKNQFKELTKGENFNKSEFSKTILLFDSIDFIKDSEIRLSIYQQIEEFSKENEENNYQIIIATRSFNFIQSQELFKDFKDSELLPFNFKQAMTLVKKIIPNNSSKTNNFLTALKNSMLNTTLQRTPLSLTLLAILYRDDKIDLKELPANIFSLYDLFTDVYLDKWDSTKGLTQLYKYEQTKNILAFIAFYLHKLGWNSISQDDLNTFLITLREKYNYDELNDIDNFIIHLKSRNGVFNFEEISNSFSFFNHYFQEYFASLCIEDEDDDILIDNFFNNWWSNSLVFYCGKNPKSNKLHKTIIEKIIPIDSAQKVTYINNHSKCLQASHAISIENRTSVVNKLIVEFDNLFKSIYKEAEENPDSIINQLPFVNIINQSKSLFESVFGSKHIATKETIEFFEKVLLDEKNNLSNITNYNIAYFLAFINNSVFSLEVFADLIGDDIVWNRILYVDINFLKMKKTIDDKKYVRIKRKMNKNKFLIQHILRNSVTEKNKLIE
ncbi:NACHT domain-containing protein [Crocinitomix catalasitica]|uniref:NACHT domain-containing protein n=1 Tax=Crocinitomix catalasitica TaxID=184607 RepID=UPI00048556D8|nr:NACHT domain-containing protein [Crocinitomix catalasitica]